MTTANIATPSALQEWRVGWRTVLAGGAGLGATSVYFYSLGLMIGPLQAAFGWSQGEITAAPLILSAVNLLLASRIGALVDRVGPRRVVLPGYAAFCLAFAAVGLAGPSIWSWYALWALLALTFTATAPSLWTLPIVGMFDRSRALALSVALCGTGVVGALTPAIGVWAIAQGGWRMAYATLGLGLLVVGLPIIWLCLPRRIAGASAQASSAAPLLPGISFKEAIAGWRFWALAAIAVLVGGGVAGLIVHFVSAARGNGFGAVEAGLAASLVGIAAIVGRLVMGVLMDRFPARIVGALAFVAPVAACVLLMRASSLLELEIAAIIIGLVGGAEFNVVAVLASRYFGRRAYGAIYGQIAAGFNIGVGLGPALVGLLHDRVGAYGPLFIGLGALFVVPALLTAALGREPKF